MILQADHLQKAYAGEEVLLDAAFLVNEGERWVLFGRNGSGKTTLFRMLAEELECDGGNVVLSKGSRVAHLPQFAPSDEVTLVCEYVSRAFGDLQRMEARIHHLEKAMEGAYDEKVFIEYTDLLETWRAEGGERIAVDVAEQLNALGFSQEEQIRPIARLSGGQKQKVDLARLALTRAELLLLDEPTNHLDLTAVAWLEDYLLSLRGASIVISHDVQFVRRIATRIMHLSHGKTELFHCGYDDYVEESARRNETIQKKIEEQDSFLRKNLSYIAKFGAGTRSTQAQSRRKMLDRIELLDAPMGEKHLRGLRFPVEEELPKDVLKVRHLTFGYPGGAPLISDLSFEVIKNERIAILGRNGCGKSTLIRLLMGELSPTSGTVRFGARMVPSMFDQELRTLDPKQTILDFFQARYPWMKQEDVRTRLGSFLFSGETVFDTIGVLSGGEQCRLQLLDLLLQKPNFLILDEPTNNLDLSSVSVLTASLKAFDGALLLISHDRELVAKVATRILVLAKGKIHSLPGTWAENRDLVRKLLSGDGELAFSSRPATASSRQPPVLPEMPAKKTDERKKPNRFKIREIEETVAALEREKQSLEASLMLGDPKNFEQLNAIQAKMVENSRALEAALGDWEELHG